MVRHMPPKKEQKTPYNPDLSAILNIRMALENAFGGCHPAVALYSHGCAQAPGWELRRGPTMQRCKISRQKFTTGMKVLEMLGLARLVTKKDNTAKGHFQGKAWLLIKAPSKIKGATAKIIERIRTSADKIIALLKPVRRTQSTPPKPPEIAPIVTFDVPAPPHKPEVQEDLFDPPTDHFSDAPKTVFEITKTKKELNIKFKDKKNSQKECDQVKKYRLSAFEKFWAIYPKNIPSLREKTKKQFIKTTQKMSESEIDTFLGQCLADIRRRIADPDMWTSKRYTKAPQYYLKDECYLDDSYESDSIDDLLLAAGINPNQSQLPPIDQEAVETAQSFEQWQKCRNTGEHTDKPQTALNGVRERVIEVLF